MKVILNVHSRQNNGYPRTYCLNNHNACCVCLPYRVYIYVNLRTGLFFRWVKTQFRFHILIHILRFNIWAVRIPVKSASLQVQSVFSLSNVLLMGLIIVLPLNECSNHSNRAIYRWKYFVFAIRIQCYSNVFLLLQKRVQRELQGHV